MTELAPNGKPMIEPESPLGKALMERNLWYQGDRPGGFIEGWEAHEAEKIERVLEALIPTFINLEHALEGAEWGSNDDDKNAATRYLKFIRGTLIAMHAKEPLPKWGA